MLTAEQRTAIALKAVATRRANLAAAGGRVIAPAKKRDAAAVGLVLALRSLPESSIIRYWDEGWRFAKLLRVGTENSELETIPVFSKKPQHITVATRDIAEAL